MRASSVDKAILEMLAGDCMHLTPAQVYEGIKERLPAVNLSTVYRALERLTKQGLVSVSDMGAGAAVYELVSSGRHHHLVCQECGRVITIGDEEVEPFFETIRQQHNFELKTNHLVLFGVCEECGGDQVRGFR